MTRNVTNIAIGTAIIIALGIAAAFLQLWALLIALGIATAACLFVVFLRSPHVGIYCITFALPFERLGAIEYGGITVRISQLLLLLLLAATIVRLPLKNRRGVRNPLFIPVLLFVATLITSLLASPYIGRSVTVAGYIIFTATIAFLVPYHVRTKQQVHTVLAILLASALCVSVFGLFQFFGDLAGLPQSVTGLRDLYTKTVLGFPRVQSTAYEPLYFANYLLLPIIVALSFLLAGGKTYFKKSHLAAFLAIVGSSFVLTVSRGAYIALAAGMLVLLVAYWKRLVHPARIALLLALLMAGGTGGHMMLTATGQNAATEVSMFAEHTTDIFSGASFEERAFTMERAWIYFTNRPLFGNGVGAFGPLLAPTTYAPPEHGWAIVNNEFLEIAAELGLAGLIAFVLILGVLASRAIKALRLAPTPTERALHIALLATLVAIVVQWQTFSTLYIVHIWFFFGLIIASAISDGARK